MPETASSRQNVTFASNGNQAHGYLALPPSGRGPGLAGWPGARRPVIPPASWLQPTRWLYLVISFDKL